MKVADIKPSYVATHGLGSDAKVTEHFFGESSSHGTFTVSGDIMADVHKGLIGVEEAKAQLVAPKQIEKTVDQTYESKPRHCTGTIPNHPYPQVRWIGQDRQEEALTGRAR